MAWNVKADRGQFPATPLFGMAAPPPPADDEEGLRELSGFCVRQMLVASAAEFDAAVRRPWLESGVVVLRDQPADLTPRELVEFSRRLGDLDVRPHASPVPRQPTPGTLSEVTLAADPRRRAVPAAGAPRDPADLQPSAPRRTADGL